MFTICAEAMDLSRIHYVLGAVRERAVFTALLSQY
jgi:hypothetical protein